MRAGRFGAPAAAGLVAAGLLGGLAGGGAAPAAAAPIEERPADEKPPAEVPPAEMTAYIDHTEWASWQGRPSLRVYPSAAARAAVTGPGGRALADRAWSEVLALAPEAGSPGMRAQFDCHWDWAEFAEPGKASWNLEPWRPVVSADRLLLAGCNPGDAEEPF